VMPHRGWWNDAYLGLAAYDPVVLGPRVEQAASALGINDELGWWAARDYMDRIRLVAWDGRLDPSQPAPGLKSEWMGVGTRAALQDRMVAGAFMDAVKKYPGRVLTIYLIKKPLHIISTLVRPFTRSITWVGLSLLIGVGIGAFVVLFGGDIASAPRDMILLSVGAVLAAAVPSLWAYPTVSTMGDSVLLFAAFAPFTIAIGTVTLVRSFARRQQKSVRAQTFAFRREGGNDASSNGASLSPRRAHEGLRAGSVGFKADDRPVSRPDRPPSKSKSQ
jgi:hypothetical protein